MKKRRKSRVKGGTEARAYFVATKDNPKRRAVVARAKKGRMPASVSVLQTLPLHHRIVVENLPGIFQRNEVRAQGALKQLGESFRGPAFTVMERANGAGLGEDEDLFTPNPEDLAANVMSLITG